MKLDHPEKKGLSGVTVAVLVVCAILVAGVVAHSVLGNKKDTGSTTVEESTETAVDNTKEEKKTGTVRPSSTEVETVTADDSPVVVEEEREVEVSSGTPLEVVKTEAPVIVEEVVYPVEVEVAPEEVAVEAKSGIVTVEDAPTEEVELPEEVAVEPESETGSVEETGSADEEVTEPEKSPLLYVSQTAPVSVHVEKPLTEEVDWDGYSMTVDAYTGHAVVSYPSIVTDDDVYAFATYAWENYSDYLNGVDITILGDGKAEITYPDNYGEEEFDLAISTLEEELPLYMAEVLSEETPTMETEVTVVSPVIEEAVATVVDEPADEESVVAVVDDSEEVVVEEEKPAPIEDSSVSSGNSPVEVMEKKTEEKAVNDLVKRTTVTVWGSPYGFGEIVGDGASFNFRRFVRSYVYSFNVEYDWRVNSLFTIGMKAGYDGVIHHVEGYVNQAPVMLTAGVVPFETDHSVISLDLGFGVDVVSCAVNKTFAPVLDLSFAYGFKLGDLSLNLGLGVMGEYTVATKEYRVEFNPLRLGLGYTF